MYPLVTGKGGCSPPLVSYVNRGGDFTKVRLERGGLVYTNDDATGVPEQLFDAVKDPAEQRNLAGEQPDRLAEMRKAADRIRETDRRFKDEIPTARHRAPAIPARLERQLRDLGYLQ